MTRSSVICFECAGAFLNSVGASVGPLYSSGFQQAGEAVYDRLNLDSGSLVAWMAGMADGIQNRGKADVGSKTMIDAWFPATAAARNALAAGKDEFSILTAAAHAADEGAEQTKTMLSKKRSIQNPGCALAWA